VIFHGRHQNELATRRPIQRRHPCRITGLWPRTPTSSPDKKELGTRDADPADRKASANPHPAAASVPFIAQMLQAPGKRGNRIRSAAPICRKRASPARASSRSALREHLAITVRITARAAWASSMTRQRNQHIMGQNCFGSGRLIVATRRVLLRSKSNHTQTNRLRMPSRAARFFLAAVVLFVFDVEVE